MNIKIHYDKDSGNIINAYANIDNVPEPFIEVTPEEWESYNKIPSLIVDGKLQRNNDVIQKQEAIKQLNQAQQEVEDELQEILRQMAISKYIELNKVE